MSTPETPEAPMAPLTPEAEIPLEQQIFDKAFTFPHGIIGFQDFKRYVVVQSPEEKPFAWLRSLDEEELNFAVVDAFYLNPDYTVDIDDSDLELIGSPSPMDCFILFIIRIEKGPPFRIYANLRAPLILNRVSRKGMQVILIDSPYTEDQMFEF
jgi:flagellar assembly factor FliW